MISLTFCFLLEILEEFRPDLQMRLPKKFLAFPLTSKVGSELVHKPLTLDGRVVQKILKRQFFQNIKYSFHGVTQIGVKPQQNFFSTNTGARGVQSFCVLESPNCLLIEQLLTF